MSTLGNQSTSGGTFTITGSFGDVAGGSYTVPSPGILVSQLSCVFDNNGTSGTARLYVWEDNSGIPGNWLLRSGTFATPGSMGTVNRTDISVNTAILPSSGLITGGTKIWIGYYSSTGISAWQGESSGLSELGNTADGNWNDHGPAVGLGAMAAWVTYTLAGSAYANTGTSGSPVWTLASQVAVNTGTSASPIWTVASEVDVNTGTSASPIWTPGS